MINWVAHHHDRVTALLWVGGLLVVALAATGTLSDALASVAVAGYGLCYLLATAASEVRRQRRVAAALCFYAALDPNEIPYADTINDPPDIGRVAREALARP
jgi:hypothetical protein